MLLSGADDHPSMSSASQVIKTETKTRSGSKGEVNRGAGGGGVGAVNGEACQSCNEGGLRADEGLYCPYHPFCRACQGTALDPGGQEGRGDSLYFNYMRFAAGRPPSGVPPPLLCSSYPAGGVVLGRSKTGPVSRPLTRIGTRSRPGVGDRLIAPASADRRRHHFRLPSRILFRFPSKQTTSGFSDSRLVENKAETFVGGGGGGGKTGKAVVAKNRCAGEGSSALCRRYKNQRMVVMVIFLFSLFVAIAAAVFGAVLVWSPMNTQAWSSLATDRARRNSNVDDDHVTGEADVEYISVVPSLERATSDGFGWAFYSRGSSRGSKYMIINKPLTFYSAQEHCQRLGGYLVHINTLREQLFLEDFLTQELEKLGPAQDSGIGFWIGAKRARGSHEGTCMFEQWKWVDSYGRSLSAIAGLTAFVPGKPDNQYSPEECLFMSCRERSDENRFLKWDDAPCDLNSIGTIRAVCEVEVRQN